MTEEFLSLVKIDSLSFKERKMADALTAILKDMGFSVYEDEAGSRIGGEAGNLICTVKGDKSVAPVLLMAHMDTVVPGEGKKPIVAGNIIKTDGKTILGGDDLAGVECILEAVRILKENNIAHGDIQVVFTVAEEAGLLGAKNLDYGRISAKYGFVFDGGKTIGRFAVKAPSQNRIEVELKGKAAHAGVEPEKGISAIQMAASAISRMKLGRIDEETTANVGVINGGQVTNVVCDRVSIKAEARSRDEKKLLAQTNHMRECFENAAAELGGTVVFNSKLEYPAFEIQENAEIVAVLRKAANECGIDLRPESTGGGSDTNILNGKGIQAVNISVGMDKVHSVNEQICIDDMVKVAEFIVAIIKNV